MTNEVSKVYTDIAELLNVARAKTYHVVNSIMVETYWKIGQRIVEEEQAGKSRAEYGTKLIENLSKYLTDTFGKGFSEANLKNMRQFYVTYPEFDRQCLANLSWSNITRILRIDNPKERNYYLTEASTQNWSYRQLERNIKSGYYQRLLSTQENNDNTCLPAVINPKDFVKDPYVLEFLDLPENIEGKEIFLSKCDVVVCDGFVGNVALKVTEGSSSMLFYLLKQELKSDILGMLIGLLAKPFMKRVYKRINYEEFGGCLLLGVRGISVIAHGRSKAYAIKNAVRVANEAVQRGVNKKISEFIEG